jgi:hypothetical protein
VAVHRRIRAQTLPIPYEGGMADAIYMYSITDFNVILGQEHLGEENSGV